MKLIPWHPITKLCITFYWCISALAFCGSGVYPPVAIALGIVGVLPFYTNWLMFDILYRKYAWRYNNSWADALVRRLTLNMAMYTTSASIVLIGSYLAFKEQPMLMFYSYVACAALLLTTNIVRYRKENPYD